MKRRISWDKYLAGIKAWDRRPAGIKAQNLRYRPDKKSVRPELVEGRTPYVIPAKAGIHFEFLMVDAKRPGMRSHAKYVFSASLLYVPEGDECE